MYQASLPPVSNRADWIESVEITDTETGDPIDLTGCTIRVQVREQQSGGYPGGYSQWEVGQKIGGGYFASASTDDGSVTIDGPGVFTFSFSAGTMAGLAPANYDIGALIARDGWTAQIVIGSVPVLDGIVM